MLSIVQLENFMIIIHAAANAAVHRLVPVLKLSMQILALVNVQVMEALHAMLNFQLEDGILKLAAAIFVHPVQIGN